MRRLLAIFLSVVALAGGALGQADFAWLQMPLDKANKILRTSAWAQTQTETDTSEMFFTPTRAGTSSVGASSASVFTVQDQQSRNNNRADRGALNQAVSVNYFVRFFSSRPIREALSRVVLGDLIEPGPRTLDQWQGFVDRDFGPFVVLTVSYESSDGRLLGPSIQAFAAATSDTLKNNTYLERNDGKRVYLLDYRPPGGDGLGAKFVFSRFLGNKPFLSMPKGSVRFVSDMGKNIKLNVRFSLASMVVDDKLEY